MHIFAKDSAMAMELHKNLIQAQAYNTEHAG